MMTVEAPTPCPIPAAPSRASARHAFDIVSEIGDHAVAWCIRDLSSGEQKRFLEPRTRGEEVLEDLVSAVTTWVSQRAPEGPIVLRCFSIALRDAVAVKLRGTRFQPEELIAMNSSVSWAHGMRTRLRDDIARHEHSEYAKRVMYAASDGSVHPVYGNGAYSWVTSDGVWSVDRSYANILASEVMGIVSFAKMFRAARTHSRAVLFVDSLNAIDAVVGGGYVHYRLDESELSAARALIESGRLELIWVRSHQGHPLNDVADRLALQRHRAVRTGLDECQLASLCQQIVDGAADTFQSISWADAAREARQAYQAHMLEHEQAA